MKSPRYSFTITITIAIALGTSLHFLRGTTLQAQTDSLLAHQIWTRPANVESSITARFSLITQFSGNDDWAFGESARLAPGAGRVYAFGLRQRHRWIEYEDQLWSPQLMGSEGSGPGENRGARYVTGDSLRTYVVHDQRVSAFNQTGEYLGGRVLLGDPFGGGVGVDGVVLFSRGRRPSADPIAITHISADGSVIRRASQLTTELNRPVLAARVLAYNGQFFIADWSQPYSILVGSLTTGKIAKELGGGRPWIPSVNDAAGRPMAFAVAMHAADGTLATVVAVKRDDSPLVIREYTDFLDGHDFYLELVDIESGRVLSTSRYDAPPFTGSIDRNRVYRLFVDRQTGVVSIILLQLRFAGA